MLQRRIGECSHNKSWICLFVLLICLVVIVCAHPHHTGCRFRHIVLLPSASAAGTTGHGARAPPHIFKSGWARGPRGKTRKRRNWPKCTGHHESAHQNNWLYGWSQKSGRARQKFFAGHVPPLSTLFRRHYCRPTLISSCCIHFLEQPASFSHPISSLADFCQTNTCLFHQSFPDILL